MELNGWFDAENLLGWLIMKLAHSGIGNRMRVKGADLKIFGFFVGMIGG